MAFSHSAITTKRHPATAKTTFFFCFRLEDPTADIDIDIAIAVAIAILSRVISVSKNSL